MHLDQVFSGRLQSGYCLRLFIAHDDSKGAVDGLPARQAGL